jgi:IS1 family transposase
VRGTDDCIIEFVDKRDRKTFLEVLSRKVRFGSTIASDSWQAYENLNLLLPEILVTHSSVNCSKNFINPINPEAYTQTNEAFWSILKRKLRRRGGTTYGTNIEQYFGEHLQ